MLHLRLTPWRIFAQQHNRQNALNHHNCQQSSIKIADLEKYRSEAKEWWLHTVGKGMN